jgi:hypothetical protein
LLPPPSAPPPPVIYAKLPGDFRGILRRHTAWIGADHLLLVDSTRFTETYQRFYLRDIQSIIIRRAARFAIPYYWILLAGVAVIALLIGLTPFRGPFFWPPMIVLAAMAIYLYVASMFQSCTCHLITRVNKVELRGLFRRRAARRFVEMLSPRIVAAQDELPADWVERSATLDERATAADRNPERSVEAPSSGQFNVLVVLVFLLVLVDAGLTFLQLRAEMSTLTSVVNTINMFALSICSTVAIVRLSRRLQSGRALRMLVLAGLFVVAAVAYGSVVIQSIDQQLYHERYSRPLAYPGMRGLAIFEIIADLLVATPGLILSIGQRRNAGMPGVSLRDIGSPTETNKP